MEPAGGRQVTASELGADTRRILAHAADYWSDTGAANLIPQLAGLLALDDAHAASHALGRLRDELERGGVVSALDLTRALLLAEIGIVSVVLGPSDWHNVYGDGTDYDEFMRREFRDLQRAQVELAEFGVLVTTLPFLGRRTASPDRSLGAFEK